jgi:hypothetical protein
MSPLRMSEVLIDEREIGGPRKSRTSDLALIRGAL